ncbi:MAG: hypothetical protein ACRDRW_01825 [Pseudonocardiaceae bacterium]
MAVLVERLDEMDVHEFGRLSAALAQHIDANIDDAHSSSSSQPGCRWPQ